MRQPVQSRLDGVDGGAFGQPWAIDEDDGKVARARGIELGARAVAAGVFGDDGGDLVGSEQRQIAAEREGATRNNDIRVRQQQWRSISIDETHEITMLRLGREGGEVLAADGEKDARRRVGQGGDACGDIGHGMPAVARPRCPGGALEAEQWRVRLRAGSDRIAAHAGCERMRGVDDVGDAIVREVSREAGDAAEATDARRQRLCGGRGGAAGIGEHAIDASAGKRLRKPARFRRTAQQKDARHG